MASRRDFLRTLISGSAALVATPILPALIPAAPAIPVGFCHPPISPAGFAAVLRATRDVFSSEMYESFIPVMRFDQFRSIPKFSQMQRSSLRISEWAPKTNLAIHKPRHQHIITLEDEEEILAIEARIRARVAKQMALIA